MTTHHHTMRARLGAAAAALALLTGGCTVADGSPAEVADEDLFAQVSRAVRDLDAALEAAGVADLRRRHVDGPTRCEDPQTFRGAATAAGYVTDGSSPDEILERIREVWERDGEEVQDLDVGEDRPTIGRQGEDGIRYEARVRTNRAHPLLAVDLRTPCAPVPDGYEDDDLLHEALYDDYLDEVDPGGERRSEPLDPAPDA